MRIFNSKKSTEVVSNWPFWMIFVVAIGFMIIVVVKTGNVSVAEASRIPPDLEDEVLLASRFYNSGDCFAYVDGAGRVHTNTIDFEKFTKANLDICYPPTNVNYAFQLLLEPPAVPVVPVIFSQKQIQTFNWINGKFEDKQLEEYIAVRAFNNFHTAKLTIKIQNAQ